MEKFNRLVIAACLGTITFMFIMGVVGDYDYCEYVILHMTQEQYDLVKQRLTADNGKEPTDREIAHWFAEHKQEVRKE